MYLDRPKSPSFTQSTVDTRTFLAAISLLNNTSNQIKTAMSIMRLFI